jgi:hypothetical protein
MTALLSAFKESQGERHTMVVGGHGKRLDSSVDEEIDEDRLDLGLARLEVIYAKGRGEGSMTSVSLRSDRKSRKGEGRSMQKIKERKGRLARTSSDESLVLLCEPDHTRDEGVLGRAVDERASFKDGRNGEQGRRGDLGMGRLDRGEKVRALQNRSKRRKKSSASGAEKLAWNESTKEAHSYR